VLYTSKGYAGVMAVYVTDYTSNSEVEDDDRVLAHHPHLRKMILEVTFWDSNAAEADKQELKEGDFVFLRNLHCTVKHGTLQGVLHDNVRTGGRATIELGQTWKKMNITDPLVVELLRWV
jgi:AICAR transformylase/IMP cyclohydrolase PurH